MVAVYVSSVRDFAGKNVFCLGLGRKLREDGLKVAYMKPYGVRPLKVGDEYTDADAWMINQFLELKQTPKQCCPVLRTQDLLAKTFSGQAGDLFSVVKSQFKELSKGKDVMLLGGAGTLRSGAMLGLQGYDLVLKLGAKAVLVDRYESDFLLDDLFTAAGILKENLAGVVINGVDLQMSDALEEQIIPFLAQAGIKTLGMIPKDELLSAVSVQELADTFQAKTLTGLDHMQRLVSRFFIGAMQVSHASRFFRGARDFGCIVGGDRPDMQTAAIESGAACLVLTGGFYPGEIILNRAEEHEVPVLMVRGDTLTIARQLDLVLKRGSLSQPEKIDRAMKLVKEGVDFAALYESLGISV